MPYVAAAYLLQCTKHFDVTLVTCTTLHDIFICLGLAFGAIMLQAGLALVKSQSKLILVSTLRYYNVPQNGSIIRQLKLQMLKCLLQEGTRVAHL